MAKSYLAHGPWENSGNNAAGGGNISGSGGLLDLPDRMGPVDTSDEEEEREAKVDIMTNLETSNNNSG